MRSAVTPRRRRLAQWSRELALGVRLSVAGRSGWARLAMIALGVGLGVAMLLVGATIPTLVAAQDARVAARAWSLGDPAVPRGADTLLIARADTLSQYRDQSIHGWLVQPEGELAPLPPGVNQLPGADEMVVSPALARLLESDEGSLLRGRWGARVVGTIDPAGLSGPGEYAFYLGTDRLTENGFVTARVRSFGLSDESEGMGGILLLLAAVGLVVLLLPVAIFVATAARFGGEARDRQLAALRLVGADAAMTGRIAAGETLTGAVLGLVTGGLLYAGVGLLASGAGMSFYLADFRPVPALAVLVVVMVPVAAVLVTVSALRRVVVEPLGVVRRSGDRPRRLWWRLILPVAGLALLYPLHAGVAATASGFAYQAMAGVAALLVGVSLLLPWLVEATVRRMGGGGVAWQLAVRQLQLDSGTAVRAVSGIAVSIAGLIALQGLLAAVQVQYTHETGLSTDKFQAVVLANSTAPAGGWDATLSTAPGVSEVGTVASVPATPSGPAAAPEAAIVLDVGDCAVLRQLARLDDCSDGDTFVVADGGGAVPIAGSTYTLGEPTGAEAGSSRQWTLPATVRTVAATNDGGPPFFGIQAILATPSVLPDSQWQSAGDVFYVALDPADPDALDRLRNVVARVDPRVVVEPIQTRTVEATLLSVRQGLLVGTMALLVLIGASMLVNVVEQLRERRRLLAVLVAFGTRRTVLTGSVFYQVAIPVVLGLTLAVVTGGGLAAILQTIARAPIRFDLPGIAITSIAAALVVVVTTMATLPLLWRLTRSGGLRSE